ncbi:MAG: DUF721 domain-containing protein [Candidatus Delongbacteria bacterium]|nr:DUF721 domain-containing protein [Candidatus Delongbacteria bacterium]
MKSLQQILRDLLAELPAEHQARIKSFQALADWPDIVGATIAAVTEPVKLENGILLVQVTEAVWKGELQFMKAELMEKITGKTGIKLKDLKFV